MGARLLVVQHEPDAPAGWLGEWWAAAGVELDVVRADLGQPVPARLSDGGHDGLVVLGGAMGANDDALHPWLRPTKELLRDTVRGGSPTLGVCLGHQLASVALTPEGADDPLLAGRDGAGAVHFNDDVVGTPPPGATVLARLPDGSAQALRLGERAWSVQFHPETSPEIFGAWLRWERPDGLEPADEALLATVTAARDRLRGTWETFATRFAAQLG